MEEERLELSARERDTLHFAQSVQGWTLQGFAIKIRKHRTGAERAGPRPDISIEMQKTGKGTFQ